MSLPFIIQTDAEADIESVARSLDMARNGAGQQFLKLVRELLERIETNPLLYGTIRGNVRAATIRKYRYVVYYRVLDDRTEVIAVVHGARDQISWQARLK